MPRKLDYDPDDIRYLVEERGLQLRIVGKMMSMHEETVRQFCDLHNIKRQRTGPRNGPLHPDWKGGTCLRKGYKYLYCPDHPYRMKGHYVAEHHLVMEALIGRYLLPKEVVHHIDGDRLNNDPKNLILFSSNAKHLKSELKGKVPDWTPSGFVNMCKVNPQWLKNPQLLSKYGDDPRIQELVRQQT